MKATIKNLITIALIVGGFLAANFSVFASDKDYTENFYSKAKLAAENGQKRDDEFWDKFRDSVMPDKPGHRETEPPHTEEHREVEHRR